VLDVSRDDLEDLLHRAEAAAYQRKLGEPRCHDGMSRDPLTVSHDTPAAAAAPSLVGILTQSEPVRAPRRAVRPD
jgi:CBS-domain-containing membrane protein